MPAHPFERLSTGIVRPAALSLLGAWLLLTLLLAAAVPSAHGKALVDLLHAANADAAAALVAGWTPEVRATAGFVIGFDFLYDLVHDNAVALLCIWAARAWGAQRILRAGALAAWTMWLDILLNVPENLAALHIVRSGAAAGWFGIVVAITAFRFVTLWSAFTAGALVLAIAQLRKL